MKKFAIIGSSCAGKTTLTHSLVARLKSYGVLADGIFSQDRKFSFPLNQIESEAAQNWMITNMIAKEADLSLHVDVEVMVSDRSPLDLYAYYLYQYSTPLCVAAKRYVMEWCRTYEAIYYLDPLPYHDDNKRPPDEFRLKVDNVLSSLMDEYTNLYAGNLHKLPRNEILGDLMRRAKVVKPTVKSQLGRDDAQRLSDFLKMPILAKFPKPDADTLSDTDIFIILDSETDWSRYTGVATKIADIAKTWLRNHTGPWTNFDILPTTTADGLPETCERFDPS